MALIKCHECGKDVSTEATGCPNCGASSKNEAFEEFPLTQKQQYLSDVGKEFLNFHSQKIVPRLKDYWDKNIQPFIDSEGYAIANIPLDVKKAYHLIYCNEKLWILNKSVRLLVVCGFGDQGNSLCRTMFEIWFDSQYVGLNRDPVIVEKIIQKIENWGKIQWCQQFKEIAEFDKKWAIQIRNDKKKDLENTGKTLDQEIQKIEEHKKDHYGKKNGKIYLWYGIDQKAIWELIKTGESYESLKRAYLTVYKLGSQSVHGSDFWVAPKFPSDDLLRLAALAGSFQCFFGQTEDLQRFFGFGLDSQFREFTKKHLNKINSWE